MCKFEIRKVLGKRMHADRSEDNIGHIHFRLSTDIGWQVHGNAHMTFSPRIHWPCRIMFLPTHFEFLRLGRILLSCLDNLLWNRECSTLEFAIANRAQQQASFSLRCRYLVRERMPRIRAVDDGLGAVGVEVAYRYPTILQRTRSYHTSSGSSQLTVNEHHPVEAYVRRKLTEDFTEAGRPRGIAQRCRGKPMVLTYDHPTDKYEQLMLPGRIYHMHKCVMEDRSTSGRQTGLTLGGKTRKAQQGVYWIERASPEEVRFTL